MRRTKTGRRIRAILLLIPMVTGMGCDGCGSDIGKEAAEKLAGAANNLTDQLPSVIGKMDETLQNVVEKLGGTLDKTLTNAIQETSRAIHAQIDALHDVLSGTIKQVDAMLAARIKQLTDFVMGFTQELQQMLDSGLRQLKHTAESLVASLGVTGEQLLEQVGFTVVKSVNAGGKVVITVIGGVVETVVLIIAGSVFGLSLIFGGIFFVGTVRKAGRPSLRQLAPGMSFFVIGIALGSVLLFSKQARATVASGTLELDDGVAACSKTLQETLEFRIKFTKENEIVLPKEGDAQTQTLALLTELFQCEGSCFSADLRNKARENVALLQSALGLDSHCRQPVDCNLAAGEHCDVPTGICVQRCDVDAQCQSPGVCHAIVGRCGPVCANDTTCENAALRCDRGHCIAKATPPPATGGGKIRVIPGLLDKFMFSPHIKVCIGPSCRTGSVRDPSGPVIRPGQPIRVGAFNNPAEKIAVDASSRALARPGGVQLMKILEAAPRGAAAPGR